MIHASIYGRLAKDPQERTTSTGKEMTIAALAVDATPNKADTEETVWVSVLAFGKQAETLAKHAKGEMIAATGRLTQSRWTGKDGQERTGFSLMADAIVSCRTVRPSRKAMPKAQGYPEDFGNNGPEFEDDELPF